MIIEGCSEWYHVSLADVKRGEIWCLKKTVPFDPSVRGRGWYQY